LQAQALELLKLKQRDRALLLLKLKRSREKEASIADGQLLTVQEMIDNVEWEHMNNEVLKALKTGTNTLNKLHEEMGSLEDIENLLDQTNEAIEMENQINRVIAGQLSVADDEELELELAAMMKDMKEVNTVENTSAAINFPSVPTIPVMPPVPQHTVVTEAAPTAQVRSKSAVAA
jgi:hypothetical protein